MATENGTGPRIMRREKWLELPEEYAGFSFKVWVNAPAKHWAAVGRAAQDDGDEAEAREALRHIILEHNGWLDFDGNPYPQPDQDGFWEEIPTELAACMIVAVQVEQTKLPNSLAPKRKRR